MGELGQFIALMSVMVGGFALFAVFFMRLEGRVDRLEGRVDRFEGRIDRLADLLLRGVGDAQAAAPGRAPQACEASCPWPAWRRSEVVRPSRSGGPQPDRICDTTRQAAAAIITRFIRHRIFRRWWRGLKEERRFASARFD
jgi:hypothetical protein